MPNTKRTSRLFIGVIDPFSINTIMVQRTTTRLVLKQRHKNTDGKVIEAGEAKFLL